MTRIARMLCIWSLSVLSLLSSTVTVGHAEEENINEIEIPVVGSYEGITFWWQTALADHYLFATDRNWTKLYVFDVVDPTVPTPVTSSDLPGEWIPDLQATGQWPLYSIYLLRQSGLAIYQFDAIGGHLSQVGQSDAFTGPFYPYYNLALHGTHAYIANGYTGLLIMDISDPAHPSELTRYQSDGPIVYVVVLGASVFLAVDRAVPTDGLRVVDIANPFAITEVSRYELGIENDGIGPVVVAGGYAFLHWDGPMLSDPHLDIIELSTMRQMARLDVGPFGTLLLAVRNPYLLVGGGIWDISDIRKPKYLGRYKPGHGGGSLRRPESYVYAIGAGLYILDLLGLRGIQTSVTPPFSWGSIKSRFK